LEFGICGSTGLTALSPIEGEFGIFDIDMGMRKKSRTIWKAKRKVDEGKIRKAKAIRLTKAAAAKKK